MLVKPPVNIRPGWNTLSSAFLLWTVPESQSQSKGTCIPFQNSVVPCCCLPCCLPLCSPMFPLVAISSLPRFPWLSCVSVVTHRKNSRVQISKAKLEDSGNYTCVVENPLGKDNSTGTVNVQSSEYWLLSNKWSGTDVLALLLLCLFSCQLRDPKRAITNRHVTMVTCMKNNCPHMWFRSINQWKCALYWMEFKCNVKCKKM